MTWRRFRLQRDERGASLVLAIVFMVVVGGVGGGVLASISSGVQNGVHLATARNRQYAADNAIEMSIARVRRLQGTGTGCGPVDPTYTFEPTPSVDIHVDCLSTPRVVAQSNGTLIAQNDFVFNACLASVASPTCPAASKIISADVHMQTTGSSTTTRVLSWSVNA